MQDLQFDTSEVQLIKGLKIGSDILKNITIREQLIGDLVYSATGQTDEERLLLQMARRVVRIGNIENPGRTLIEKMNATDFALLIQECAKMDAVELLEDGADNSSEKK